MLDRARTGAVLDEVVDMAGNLELAPNERIVGQAGFMFSMSLFFLHSSLVLTDKRLAGSRPNTLLGLIPVGAEKVSYPLANIASVGTSTRLALLPMLIGVVLVLASLGNPGQLWLVALLGVVLVLGAFQAVFFVANNAGQRMNFKIALTDKGKAQSFAESINATIAGRS